MSDLPTKTIVTSIIEMFTKVNIEYNAGACNRHHLTLNQDTKDLELGVWVDGVLRSFILTHNDLEDTNKLLSEIEVLLLRANRSDLSYSCRVN